MRILSPDADSFKEQFDKTTELDTSLKELKPGEVVWIDNADCPPELLKELIGNHPLILSNSSVELLTKLGMEKEEALEKTTLELRDDPWDKRGFQAYKNHPFFQELHNGFYSVYLNQLETMPDCYYYHGKKARVLAVEKRYINYLAEKAVIWLYELNGKPVLVIGGLLDLNNFNNPYKAETTRFVENIISSIGRPEIFENCWPKPDIHNIQKIYPVKDWPESSLKIENASGYFNTTGSRILANMSKDGLEEVWLHPFRILNKMRISIDGKEFSEILESVTTTPEKVVYHLNRGKLTVFSSIENPALYLQFDFKNREPHKIITEFEADLRIMWPHADNYNGKNKVKVFDNSCIMETEDGMQKVQMLTSTNSAFNVSYCIEKINGSIITETNKGESTYIIAISESKEPVEKLDLQTEIEKVTEYYRDYLKNAEIITDDHKLNNSLNFARIGAIKFRVTTPELGTGLMAGYASSRPGWFRARPGYAWYFGRDSEWCSLALLDIGDFNTVKENLELLLKYQRVDGKIYHELATGGIVHYDAADSTPLFLYTVYRYSIQSGDLDFIKCNWVKITLALNYCQGTDTDKDGLIENTVAGHGWIEGGKLYGAKASFYLNTIWLAALKGIEQLAIKLGETQVIELTKTLQINAKKGLEKLYRPDFGYALGLDEQDRQLEFKTVMTAMGAYLENLPKIKIKEQIKQFASDDFSADWGVRIIGKSSGIFNPEGYHEGTIWPLFTGWAALAQYKLGADLDGLNHILSNLYTYRDFSSGYIPEVLNGETYEMSGVCPHQAWSQTMGFQPFYEGLLGFSPNVLDEVLELTPAIPPNLEKLEAKNLKFGNNRLQLDYHRNLIRGKELIVNLKYRLTLDKPYKIKFGCWIQNAADDPVIRINGKEYDYTKAEGITSTLYLMKETLGAKELEIQLEYETPFILLPVIPELKRSCKSRLPRIIEMAKQGNYHEIKLRAKGKSEISFITSDGIEVENAEIEAGKLVFDTGTTEYTDHTIRIKNPEI